MLWVPKRGVLLQEHNLTADGSCLALPGTAITTGSSSTSKGTAVQMIASTAFDAFWVVIEVYAVGLSATTSKCALDILIGAATEAVLIPNLLVGGAGNPAVAGPGAQVRAFPLYIPAGSRLAAQAAGLRTSAQVNVVIRLYGGDGYPPWRVGSKVVTYRGAGAIPTGVSCTPATGESAPNLDQEITSSTSEDHFAVFPSLQNGTDTTITPAKNMAVHIGIGAATSEPLGGTMSHFIFKTDTTEFLEGPANPIPVFADIPSGSRLVVGIGTSQTADAANPEVALHCVS
jgi:hypothetical protein